MKKLGYSKDFWMIDAGAGVATIIALLIGPWWTFAIVAWANAFYRSIKKRPARVVAALNATAAWIVLAFVRDAMNGFRISHRVGGFLSLPSGFLLYVVIAILAFVTAWLAASSGDLLGRSAHRTKAAR